MSTQELLQRRARVVTAALRAAYAWSVHEREPRAFEEIARMTGVVMFEMGPGRGPVTPLGLVECLQRPLAELVGQMPADCVLDADDLGAVVLLDPDGKLTADVHTIGSDYVREVIAGLDPGTDWLPSWSWMRANDVEEEVFSRLRDSGGAVEYQVARSFLVEHPAGNERELTEARRAAGAASVARYEAIPEAQSYRHEGRRWWWACPVCRWPMVVQGRSVACRYRFHQASYQVTEGRSVPRLIEIAVDVPAGVARAVPRPLDAEGALQVQEPVWRFIVVPGATELRLAGLLRRAGATRVELYPNRDAYDLDIVAGECQWDVDVKEHATAEGLSRSVAERPPCAKYIVVPQTHAGQVHSLRRSMDRYRVLTEQESIDEVKTEARRSRRRKKG